MSAYIIFLDTDSNDKLFQEDNVVVVVGLNNDDLLQTHNESHGELLSVR